MAEEHARPFASLLAACVVAAGLDRPDLSLADGIEHAQAWWASTSRETKRDLVVRACRLALQAIALAVDTEGELWPDENEPRRQIKDLIRRFETRLLQPFIAAYPLSATELFALRREVCTLCLALASFSYLETRVSLTDVGDVFPDLGNPPMRDRTLQRLGQGVQAALLSSDLVQEYPASIAFLKSRDLVVAMVSYVLWVHLGVKQIHGLPEIFGECWSIILQLDFTQPRSRRLYHLCQSNAPQPYRAIGDNELVDSLHHFFGSPQLHFSSAGKDEPAEHGLQALGGLGVLSSARSAVRMVETMIKAGTRRIDAAVDSKHLVEMAETMIVAVILAPLAYDRIAVQISSFQLAAQNRLIYGLFAPATMDKTFLDNYMHEKPVLKSGQYVLLAQKVEHLILNVQVATSLDFVQWADYKGITNILFSSSGGPPWITMLWLIIRSRLESPGGLRLLADSRSDERFPAFRYKRLLCKILDSVQRLLRKLQDIINVLGKLLDDGKEPSEVCEDLESIDDASICAFYYYVEHIEAMTQVRSVFQDLYDGYKWLVDIKTCIELSFDAEVYRRLEQAQETLERTTDYSAMSRQLKGDALVVLAILGQYQKAVESGEKCLQGQPGKWTLHNLALAYLDWARHDRLCEYDVKRQWWDAVEHWAFLLADKETYLERASVQRLQDVIFRLAEYWKLITSAEQREARWLYERFLRLFQIPKGSYTELATVIDFDTLGKKAPEKFFEPTGKALVDLRTMATAPERRPTLYSQWNNQKEQPLFFGAEYPLGKIVQRHFDPSEFTTAPSEDTGISPAPHISRRAVDSRRLFEAMMTALNMQEFIMLCFLLKVEPEHLPGQNEGLPILILELIKYHQRRSRYEQFVEQVFKMRPDLKEKLLA